MRRFAALALTTTLLLTARAAAAQTPDTLETLVEGRRAIAFEFPNGGGTSFGFWRVASPTRSNGMFVTLSTSYSHSDADTLGSSGTDVQLTLGPRARRYLGRVGPVLPFAESGIDVGAAYRHISTPDGLGGHATSTSWDLLAGLQAGGGAEWFPLRRVSLAVSTGFALSGRRSHNSGGAPTVWTVGLRTFTSALTGQFYF